MILMWHWKLCKKDLQKLCICLQVMKQDKKSLRKILKVLCTVCFKLTTQDTDGLKWCLRWNSTFPLFSRKITTRRKFYFIQWETLKIKLPQKQPNQTAQKEKLLLREQKFLSIAVVSNATGTAYRYLYGQLTNCLIRAYSVFFLKSIP